MRRDDAGVFEMRQNLFALGKIAGPVNLQREIAARVTIIDQVGGGHAVDPDLEVRAERLDPESIPAADLERLPADRIIFHRVQPLPDLAEVLEDATGPFSRRGIDLHHVAPELDGRIGQRVDGAK